MKKLLLAAIAVTLIASPLDALVYTVQQNDTLWGISNKYGVEVRTLSLLNELIGDTVRPGQTLVIPDKIVEYTVQSGDNLIRIASRMGSDIKYIILYNNLFDEMLPVGRKLLIPVINTTLTTERPAETPTIPDVYAYTVVSGDTLLGIAIRFGVTQAQIMEWNHKTVDMVYIGEKLKLYPTKMPETPTNSVVMTTTTTVRTTTTTLPPDRRVNYTVRSGDTLIGISARHGVSPSNIMEWNHKSVQTVFIGENLVIYPAPGYPVDGSLIIHEVIRGETLSHLAVRYGVSIQSIMEWNRKTTDSVIAGERLKIYSNESLDIDTPVASTTTARQTVYTVARGDTMTSIASHFGVTLDEIKKWNRLDRDYLYAGERLTLNVAGYTPSPSTHAVTGPAGTVKIQYTVMAGDTLGLIASRYDIGKSEILSWNGRMSETIYVGEKLTLFVPPERADFGADCRLKWDDFKLYPVVKETIQGIDVTARGIRLNLNRATEVYSMQEGKVEYAGLMDGFRYVAIIRYSSNRLVVYGYLGSLKVTAGQTVSSGQCIGKVDYFNLYDKICLYLELRESGNFVNVLGALPFVREINRRSSG